jgi:hypothetical protein
MCGEPVGRELAHGVSLRFSEFSVKVVVTRIATPAVEMCGKGFRRGTIEHRGCARTCAVPPGTQVYFPLLPALPCRAFTYRRVAAASFLMRSLRRLSTDFSFAPSGLVHFFLLSPTACAVGCILAPLRGLPQRLKPRFKLRSPARLKSCPSQNLRAALKGRSSTARFPIVELSGAGSARSCTPCRYV